MWNNLAALFDSSGFPPRWYCGSWTPALGWMHILSDLGVWSAYVAIPCVLGYFLVRRKDLPFRAIFLLFGAFILACGTTHLMEAVIFWWPAYRLAGVIKLFTAVVSWATVAALVPTVPKALTLRAPAELEREIAERVRVEAALRVSEERFRLLVAGVDEYAIFLLDPGGHVSSWNVGAERCDGYQADEIIGQHFSRFYPADDIRDGKPDRVLVEAAARGKCEDEGWRVRKDGSRFWANVVITALRGESGELKGFSKITRDLTARKQADDLLRAAREELEHRVAERTTELAAANEELRQEVAERRRAEERLRDEVEHRRAAEDELRQAQAGLESRVADRTAALEQRTRDLIRSEQALSDRTRLLRAILNSLGEAVIVADEAGRFVYFNPAAERILGAGPATLNPDEWSGHYRAFLPDGVTPAPTEDHPLLRAIRGETTTGKQMLIRSEAGGDRFITITGTPLESEDGLVPKGGVVVFRDITDIKTAEAALRESEERFRNAFDHAPSGMYICGLDGRWLRVNLALCRIVGRGETELLATTWNAVTHPDDVAPNAVFIRRLVDGDIPYYHIEKRYIHRDGRVVWVFVGGSIVRDGADGSAYIVGHVHDISERKQAEVLVMASLTEKQVLLREIHHRVKNNMQVICSLLDLQAQDTDDATAAAMLRDSQHRVRSMALVHEQLYQRETLSSIEFGEYVRNLVGNLAAGYGAAGGRVVFNLNLPPVRLGIDSAVPCGLLINELISNCLKHAFPNNRSGSVLVDLTRTGGEVILRIVDDGVGVPANATLHDPKTFGLRLVSALVDQLHGTAVIERQGGTAVLVRFPVPPGDL